MQFVDAEDGREEGGYSTFNPEAYEVCWNSDSVDVFVSTGLCLEVKDDADQISGFELMDIDGEWHSAAAVLSDKELWNAGEGTEILHVT